MTLVVIQRGHVPRSSGSTGAPGEQQFAIDTAAALAPLLRGMGLDVRVIDADEPSWKYRGDLFVSLHYDSSASSTASGASVGYQSAEGHRLARLWKLAYTAEGWTRGFRDDNYTTNLGQYYGVREAIAQGNRAAIITEAGFITNDGDRRLMTPARTARSIARAVADYTGTPMEDDMALTDDDIDRIVDALIARQIAKWHPGDQDSDDTQSLGKAVNQGRGFARDAWLRAGQIARAVDKMADTLPTDVRDAVRAELADAVDDGGLAIEGTVGVTIGGGQA